MILLAAFFQIGATVVIQPEHPRWGQFVQIQCDFQNNLTVAGSNNPVIVVYQLTSSRQPVSYKRWGRAQRAANHWIFRFRVPDDTAYLDAFCLVLHRSSFGYAGAMIFKSPHQPARGAHARAMQPLIFDPEQLLKHYREHFQKERQWYPDHLAVYVIKWDQEDFLQRVFPQKTILKISRIKRELREIEKRPGSDPEKCYVLSVGWALVGEKERSVQWLREMFEQWPDSVYTWEALMRVPLLFFKQGRLSEAERKEFEQWRHRIEEKNPDAPWVRDMILYEWKNHDLAVIEKAVHATLKDEPENPWPRSVLARAYAYYQQNLHQAAELIEKAINLTLSGYYQIWVDVGRSNTTSFLAEAYKTAAKIFLNNHEEGRAVVYAHIAASLMKELKKPDVRPYILEAQAWESMGWLDRAERLYRRAVEIGDPTNSRPALNASPAVSALKRLYQQRHGSLEGFEQYLKIQLKQSTGPNLKAPDFEVTTLEGQKLSLSRLKGRVVVLNFWATTCAPCVAEIPDLNKLVAKYKEKGVIFIALSVESEEMIEYFVKKRPFAYHLVARASDVLELFNINVYPVHIVIDARGQIQGRLEGGGKDSLQQLNQLIQQALQAND